MHQPVISVCGTYAVVYDVGGNNLYVIHNKEVVFEYTSRSGCDLLSARVNENGRLAVVEEASGYKASVRIYNSEYKTGVVRERFQRIRCGCGHLPQ